MYKNKYVFKKDIEIKTPCGAEDFSEIKKEISQTAEVIVNKSTYPNGVIIEIHQYADRIEVYSDSELKVNENGELTF